VVACCLTENDPAVCSFGFPTPVGSGWQRKHIYTGKTTLRYCRLF